MNIGKISDGTMPFFSFRSDLIRCTAKKSWSDSIDVPVNIDRAAHCRWWYAQ